MSIGRSLLWSRRLGRLGGARARASAVAGGGSSFSLASLPWTVYLEAPYTGSPWSGTASAGTSGANAFSDGTPPSVGAALNTFNTADVNGSTQQLVGAAMSTYLTASAFTILALFNADTAPAAGDDQPSLFGDVNGYVGLGFNTNGITAYTYDGATKTRASAQATGAWCLGMAKLDAGQLYVGRNGVWGTPVACGNVGDLTGVARIGNSWSATRFDGRLARILVANVAVSDANIASILADTNTRYGLAL